MKLNNLELSIANYLNKFPRIKYFLKRSYLILMYFFYRKSFKIKSDYQIFKIDNNKNTETFFGYYDLCPINGDGLIIYHESIKPTHMNPNQSNQVTITVYDLFRKKNIYSITSKAFNWQQGTRAQWLDTKHFIFNDFNETSRKYVSRIVSIEKKDVVYEYNYQVCSAYSDLYFLSLNYQRIYSLNPEYGYFNLSKLSNDKLKNIKNDGVNLIDLKEKKLKLNISIQDVVNVDYKEDFSKASHMLIHICISPNGRNFIFIHRYYIKNRRFDRLMLYCIESKKINCLCSEQIVSHFYWKNDREILAYLKYNNRLGYWLIDIKNKKFRELSIFANDRDGHPTGNNNVFISDTYPDKASMQKLFIYDFNKSRNKLIGEFFHGFKFRDANRCDLHPRYCKNNQILFFDSIYSGKRQLYYLKLDETKI